MYCIHSGTGNPRGNISVELYGAIGTYNIHPNGMSCRGVTYSALAP